MQVEVSERNFERLLSLKEAAGADSIDEVIDWLLDFWFSWSERNKDGRNGDIEFGFDL